MNMATQNIDKDDTTDRLTSVIQEIEQHERAGDTAPDVDLRTIMQTLNALRANERKLVNEFATGEYFAKSSDIFPKGDAEHKNIDDMRGMAEKLQRGDQLDAYRIPIKALKENLKGKDGLIPDYNSLAPSDASSASVISATSRTSGASQTRDKVANLVRMQDPVEGADAKACIINGKVGHKGHQGSDSSTCSAWWAPVYTWMVGNIDELEELVKKINNEKDPRKQQGLKDILYKALVVLSVGALGGTAGMRSNDRNILFVPNPHDEYYDSGCNWVIFPIMTSEAMKKWQGESYWVAIFMGETIPEVNQQGQGPWKDGKSRHNSKAAESAILDKLFLVPGQINICSTSDLQTVGKSLGEMGLALADLHTRESSGSDFKVRIIDLASAVKQYLVERKTTESDQILEKASSFLNNAPTNYEELENLQSGIDFMGKATADNTARIEKQVAHDKIVEGITDLIKHLKDKGLDVPVLPTKNHFGSDGKHVFKAKIQQKFATDPIVMAAKGANNFYRQWGMRMLTGCRCKPTDDDSSSGFGGSGDSSSSSVRACSVATPTTPVTPGMVLTGALVVTPDRGDVDNDACSDVSSLS